MTLYSSKAIQCILQSDFTYVYPLERIMTIIVKLCLTYVPWSMKFNKVFKFLGSFLEEAPKTLVVDM